MIYLEPLVELRAAFERLTMVPLTVTAEMRSGLCDYEPLHLDGLLAKAVIVATLHTQTLPDTNDPYMIPLPLARLWTSPEGLPLWASSVFRPVGVTTAHTTYIHKRNATMRFSNKDRLVTRKGRYMERRIPIPTTTARAWEARCIGDRDRILDLLAQFDYIGKHRSRGLGAVSRWRVEPADWSPTDIWRDGATLIKPVPVEAELLELWPHKPTRIGWTPPHWLPALFTLGWQPGTSTQAVDQFAA